MGDDLVLPRHSLRVTERQADQFGQTLAGGGNIVIIDQSVILDRQLIMQSRTGHGLGVLMLDEPTENLGSEDGSIERLLGPAH